jgi:hypothetical protein
LPFESDPRRLNPNTSSHPVFFFGTKPIENEMRNDYYYNNNNNNNNNINDNDPWNAEVVRRGLQEEAQKFGKTKMHENI